MKSITIVFSIILAIILIALIQVFIYYCVPYTNGSIILSFVGGSIVGNYIYKFAKWFNSKLK